MKKILLFLKSEAVLSVAALLAIISSFIVLPDGKYISYCNFEVLGILFALMLVVAGLKASGVFELAGEGLASKVKSEKMIIFVLSCLCFVSSALITNDVALITFVPFSFGILKNQHKRSIAFAVVMETIAANLGSLATPIGNPQNLFLYSYYSMGIGEFFRITLPLAAICFVLICAMISVRKNIALVRDDEKKDVKLNTSSLILFSALFIICILSVLGIVEWYISLGIICIATLLYDKKLYADADYILLVTFVCFFVFVGNMARIDIVHTTVTRLLEGRELLFSALASQVISNVPAAAMLAPFTNNAAGLIRGTNIGGLGTLIASMASLISYRCICKSGMVKPSMYLIYFSILNFALLIILLCMMA